MSKKYTGAGKVLETDYHEVVFTGKTKGGSPVKITLKNAINMGNIDLTHAEKNDVVAQIVYTGTYENTDVMSEGTEEPWEIEFPDEEEGADEIMLGAGIISIDGQDVGLTRGGSQFNTNRTFREINADNDRGAVKGRIEMTEARPTLTINTLQIINKFKSLYAGVQEVN